MRSIRLSLAVYFLALLAVELGAVSVFAYRYTEHMLESKEESRKTLLNEHFKRETDFQRANLERTVRNLHRSFAGSVQWQLLPPGKRGPLPAPADFKLNEDAIFHDPAAKVVEYLQINM